MGAAGLYAARLWSVEPDNEDDGLIRGEGDDAEQEGGIEDEPHDGEASGEYQGQAQHGLGA
jgi:hypothetical protein